MDQEAIIHYIADTFTGVEVVRPTDGAGAGDTSFFYDPQRNIDPTRRLPSSLATIVKKTTEIAQSAARHSAGPVDSYRRVVRSGCRAHSRVVINR
jgi:hypothetical protein